MRTQCTDLSAKTSLLYLYSRTPVGHHAANRRQNLFVFAAVASRHTAKQPRRANTFAVPHRVPYRDLRPYRPAFAADSGHPTAYSGHIARHSRYCTGPHTANRRYIARYSRPSPASIPRSNLGEPTHSRYHTGPRAATRARIARYSRL